MITIWKYPFSSIGEAQTIGIPAGGEPLRFAMQLSNPTMWALVDTERAQIERTFIIVGTGSEVPKGASYIGSCDDRQFVWHLFELPTD